VNCVRFSRCGDFLASAGVEGLIVIWRETGAGNNDWKQHCILRGHTSDISDLSWAPSGTQLVSGSIDNSAILWNFTASEKVITRRTSILSWVWDGIPLERL